MLNVVCVLKSGGDYDWEYVTKLHKAICKNITYAHKFIVLADIFPSDNEVVNIEIIPLCSDLKSYWAKLEAFRIKGEVLYFDLDTVILSNLDLLVEGMRVVAAFHNNAENTFFMMRAFSSNRVWASGIMGWIGDFSCIFETVKSCHITYYKKWEQDYIVDCLTVLQRKIYSIDDCIGKTIYSYKHDCKKGIPLGAEIICFHGIPRPRDVNWLEKECKK